MRVSHGNYSAKKPRLGAFKSTSRNVELKGKQVPKFMLSLAEFKTRTPNSSDPEVYDSPVEIKKMYKTFYGYEESAQSNEETSSNTTSENGDLDQPFEVSVPTEARKPFKKVNSTVGMIPYRS